MKPWHHLCVLFFVPFLFEESSHAVFLHVPALEVTIPEKYRTPIDQEPATHSEHPPLNDEDPFFSIEPKLQEAESQDDLFLTLIFAKGRLGFGTTEASQILLREIAKDSSDRLAKFTLKVPPSGVVEFNPIDFSIRPINKKDPQVQRFGFSTNAFNLTVLVLHHGPIFTWKNTIAGRQSVYNSIPSFEVDRGYYRWIKVQIIPFSVLMAFIEKLQNTQLNNLQALSNIKIQFQDDLLYQGPE